MESKIISYLTFKIGSEYFAANVKNIQNIIEYSKVTQVPDMPSYLMGVVNLRGEVLPVIDSRIKLAVPATEITTNTCIIVLDLMVDGSETRAGMLVDEVSEVLEVEDADILKTPTLRSDLHNNVIIGVYPKADKFILFLDVYKMILTNEVLSLAVA